MTEFELNVLRWLDGRRADEPTPGAALNQACEALRGNGLIDLRGNPTPKGRDKLNPPPVKGYANR